ncbi:MAG: hypothetical protein V1725_06195 [archaeon]
MLIYFVGEHACQDNHYLTCQDGGGYGVWDNITCDPSEYCSVTGCQLLSGCTDGEIQCLSGPSYLNCSSNTWFPMNCDPEYVCSSGACINRTLVCTPEECTPNEFSMTCIDNDTYAANTCNMNASGCGEWNNGYGSCSASGQYCNMTTNTCETPPLPPGNPCTDSCLAIGFGCRSDGNLYECMNVTTSAYGPGWCLNWTLNQTCSGGSVCNASAQACTFSSDCPAGARVCADAYTEQICTWNASMSAYRWQSNPCMPSFVCIAGVCAENFSFSGFLFDATNAWLDGQVIVQQGFTQWIFPTVAGRYITLPLIPALYYNLTAKSTGYRPNMTCALLDQTKEINFTLQPLQTIRVFGRVNDTNGNNLSGVNVSTEHFWNLSVNGDYSVLAYEGDFLFTAFHPNYALHQHQFSTLVDQEWNVTLTETSCFWFQKRTPQLMASVVQGQRRVDLFWTNPCNGYKFTLYKSNGSCTNLRPYIQNLTTLSFQDRDIEGGMSYCYAVAVFHDAINGPQTISPPAYVSAMDEHCLNGISSFCSEDRTQLFNCTSTNNATDITAVSHGNATLDRVICLDGNSTSPAKFTYKANCTTCGGLFNMFNYPLSISYRGLVFFSIDEDNDTNRTCSQIPICYAAPTPTVKDAYDSCENVHSCYDYASEAACISDNTSCRVAQAAAQKGCAWQQLQGFSTLGKGVCSPVDESLQDCSQCNNQYFGCSQETCAAYGSCYYNAHRYSMYDAAPIRTCMNKRDVACEWYDLEECAPSQNYSMNHTTHARLTFSNDSLGLGLCALVTEPNPDDPVLNVTSCVKDANNDDSHDCEIGDVSCMLDFNPPITNFSYPSRISDDFFSLNWSTIDEEGHQATTYICFNETTCTPQTTITAHPYQLTADKFNVPGNYTFFYYAEDTAHNLEVVKNFTLFVDKYVNMNVTNFRTYIFDAVADEWKTTLAINFSNPDNELVLCWANLTRQDNHLLIDSDLVINMSEGKEWLQTFENLPDATYLYTWKCYDTVANVNSGVQTLRLAANASIYDEDPVGRILNTTSVTIAAHTHEDGMCRYNESFMPYASMSSSFDPATYVAADNYLHAKTITLPANAAYTYYIQCNLTDGYGNYRIFGKDTNYVWFSIDTQAPITALVDNNGDGIDDQIDHWMPYRGFRLNCLDPAIPAPGEFGCENISYCLGYFCSPTPVTTDELPLTNDVIPYVQYLKYYSTDAGGNGEPQSMTLLSFDNLTPDFTLSLNAFYVTRGLNIITNQTSVVITPDAIDYLFSQATFGQLGTINLPLTNFTITGKLRVLPNTNEMILTFRANAASNYSLKIFNNGTPNRIIFFKDGSHLEHIDHVLPLNTELPFVFDAKGDTFNFSVDNVYLNVTDTTYALGSLKRTASQVQFSDLLVKTTHEYTSGVDSTTITPQTRTLSLGPQALSFTVADFAGNERTKSFNVTLDTQPPSIQITSMRDGMNANVLSTGNAEVGTFFIVNFTINDTNYTGSEQNINLSILNGSGVIFTDSFAEQNAYSERFNFTDLNNSGNSINLSIGTYTLRLEAEDPFGHAAVLDHQFVINDTIPPAFTLSINATRNLSVASHPYMLLRNKQYQLDITASENVNDLQAVLLFVDDGEPRLLDVNGSGMYYTAVIDSRTFRGKNNKAGNITVAAIDLTGNLGSAHVNVTAATLGKSQPSIFIPNVSEKYTRGVETIYGYAPTTNNPEGNLGIRGFLTSNTSLSVDQFFTEAFTDWTWTGNTTSAPPITSSITAYTSSTFDAADNIIPLQNCDGLTAVESNPSDYYVDIEDSTHAFYRISALDCSAFLLSLNRTLETIPGRNSILNLSTFEHPKGWYALSFNISDAPDGRYKLFVVANDSDGLGDNFTSKHFILDTTSPVISINDFFNNTASSTPLLAINMSLADRWAIDLDVTSVTLNKTRDGISNVTTRNCTSGLLCRQRYAYTENESWVFWNLSTLPETHGIGRYAITVFAKDKAGNEQTATFNYVTDDTLPGQPLINISHGMNPWNTGYGRVWTRSATPTIYLDFEEPIQNISITDILLNGVSILDDLESMDARHTKYALDNSTLLANTDNVLNITARKTNGSGTWGPEGQVFALLTEDEQQPWFVLSDVYMNTCTPACIGTLRGNYSEPNFFNLEITGNISAPYYTETPPAQPFIITLELNESDALIYASMRDRAGNLAYLERQGQYDNESPELELLEVISRPDGYAFADNNFTWRVKRLQGNTPIRVNVTIRGRIVSTDYQYVNLRSTDSTPVLNVNITPDINGFFSYDLPQELIPITGRENNYTYNLSIYDLAGNVLLIPLRIVYDLSPPLITVQYPAGHPARPYDIFSNEPQPMFSLLTDEGTLCNLTYYPQDSLLLWTDSIEGYGSTHQQRPSYQIDLVHNAFNVTCADLVGNTANAPYHFFFDNEGPRIRAITLTTPTSNYDVFQDENHVQFYVFNRTDTIINFSMMNSTGQDEPYTYCKYDQDDVPYEQMALDANYVYGFSESRRATNLLSLTSNETHYIACADFLNNTLQQPYTNYRVDLFSSPTAPLIWNVKVDNKTAGYIRHLTPKLEVFASRFLTSCTYTQYVGTELPLQRDPTHNGVYDLLDTDNNRIFDDILDLQNGFIYRFDISCQGAGSETASITVMTDNSTFITITDPENGEVFNDPLRTITVVTEPDSNVTVLVNNTNPRSEFTTTPTLILQNVLLRYNGSNNISARTLDHAENTAQDSTLVVYNMSGPSVNISLAINDNQFSNQELWMVNDTYNLTMNFQSSNPLFDITRTRLVFENATHAPVVFTNTTIGNRMLLTPAAPFVLVNDYTLAVVAYDQYGVAGSTAFFTILIRPVPKIVATSPQDGIIVYDTEQNFSGTFTPYAEQAYLRINNRTIISSNPAFQLTSTTYTYASALCQDIIPGLNTWTVFAALNETWANTSGSLTLQQSLPPNVTLFSTQENVFVDDNTFRTNQTQVNISINISDDDNGWYVIENATHRMASGNFSTLPETHTFTLTGLTNGASRHLNITAQDKTCNVRAIAVTVVNDNQAPLINITEPFYYNNQLFASTVTPAFVIDTDESASCTVMYTHSGAYGEPYILYLGNVSGHHHELLPDQQYFSIDVNSNVNITCKDVFGNSRTVTPWPTFRFDNTPPAISDFTISSSTDRFLMTSQSNYERTFYVLDNSTRLKLIMNEGYTSCKYSTVSEPYAEMDVDFDNTPWSGYTRYSPFINLSTTLQDYYVSCEDPSQNAITPPYLYHLAHQDAFRLIVGVRMNANLNDTFINQLHPTLYLDRSTTDTSCSYRQYMFNNSAWQDLTVGPAVGFNGNGYTVSHAVDMLSNNTYLFNITCQRFLEVDRAAFIIHTDTNTYVNITDPANNVVSRDPSINITVQHENDSRLIVFVNNTEQYNQTTNDMVQTAVPILLPGNGSSPVKARIIDHATNTAEHTITLVYNMTGPLAALTLFAVNDAPYGSNVEQLTSAEIQLDSLETPSRINLANTAITVFNTMNQPVNFTRSMPLVPGNTVRIQLDNAATLPGDYRLNVVARDAFNASGSTASFIIAVRNAANILSENPPAVITEANALFNGTLTPYADRFELHVLRPTRGWQNVTIFTAPATTYAYTASCSLLEQGLNEYTLYAVLNGTASWLERTVELQPSGVPNLSVDVTSSVGVVSKENATTFRTNASAVNLSLTFSDDDGGTYRVNGTNLNVQGQFNESYTILHQFTLAMQAGQDRLYPYDINVNDRSCNELLTMVTVIRDDKAPIIGVRSPFLDSGRLYAASRNAVINVSTDEQATCQLTYTSESGAVLPGEFASADNRTHTFYGVFLNNTPVVINCTDVFGHVGRTTPQILTFIVDDVPPSILEWDVINPNSRYLRNSTNSTDFVKDFIIYRGNGTDIRVKVDDRNATCKYDLSTTTFENMQYTLEEYDVHNTPPYYVQFRIGSQLNFTEGEVKTLHVSCADPAGNVMDQRINAGETSFYYDHFTYRMNYTSTIGLFLGLYINNKENNSYINNLNAQLRAITFDALRCRYTYFIDNAGWQELGEDIMSRVNYTHTATIALENNKTYRFDVYCDQTSLEPETKSITIMTDNYTFIHIDTPRSGEFTDPALLLQGTSEPGNLTITLTTPDDQRTYELQTTGSFTQPITLFGEPDGFSQNTITAHIRDRADNTASDTVMVSFNWSGPLTDARVGINGQEPIPITDTTVRQLRNITIALDTVDARLDLERTNVSFRDATHNIPFTRTNLPDAIFLSFSPPRVDIGSYDLDIIPRANDGSAGLPHHIIVRIHPNATIITVENPAEDHTTTASVLFNGTLEPYANRTYIAFTTSHDITTSNRMTTFSYTSNCQDLVHGWNDYIITACIEEFCTPLQGSMYLEERMPTINLTAVLPASNVYYDPANDVWRTNLARVNLSGTVVDDDGSTFLIWNGSRYIYNTTYTTQHEFFVQANLTTGVNREVANNFTFLAFDQSSCTPTTLLATVLYDSAPPHITFNYPVLHPDRSGHANQIYAREDSPVFDISTNEPARCNLTYTMAFTGGISNTISCDGDFSTTHSCITSPIEQNTQTVITSCVDVFGNTNTTPAMRFFVDNIPPNITWGITTPNYTLQVQDQARNYTLYYSNLTQLNITTQAADYASCVYSNETTQYEFMLPMYNQTPLERRSAVLALIENVSQHWYISCRDFVGNTINDAFREYYITFNPNALYEISLTIDGKGNNSFINNLTPTLRAGAADMEWCKYTGQRWTGSGWVDTHPLTSMTVYQGGANATTPLLENNNTYLFSVTCKRQHQLTTFQERIITTTDTTTFIHIDNPSNGEVFNDSIITIDGSAETPGTINVSVQNSNGLTRYPAFASEGAFVQDISLVRGQNTIRARITDRAGNVAEHAINVTLDLLGPEVSIAVGLNGNSPDEHHTSFSGQYLSSILLSMESVDLRFNISLTEINLSDQGQVPFTRTYGLGTITLTIDPTRYLGNYTLRIKTFGNDSTIGSSKIVFLTIDPDIPSITLSSPHDGYVNNASVRFSGSIQPMAQLLQYAVYNETGGIRSGILPFADNLNTTFNYVVNNALTEGRNDYYVTAVLNGRSSNPTGGTLYLVTSPPSIQNVTIG